MVAGHAGAEHVHGRVASQRVSEVVKPAGPVVVDERLVEGGAVKAHDGAAPVALDAFDQPLHVVGRVVDVVVASDDIPRVPVGPEELACVAPVAVRPAVCDLDPFVGEKTRHPDIAVQVHADAVDLGEQPAHDRPRRRSRAGTLASEASTGGRIVAKQSAAASPSMKFRVRTGQRARASGFIFDGAFACTVRDWDTRYMVRPRAAKRVLDLGPHARTQARVAAPPASVWVQPPVECFEQAPFTDEGGEVDPAASDEAVRRRLGDGVHRALPS